jgi:hypothetical protein
MSRYSAVPCGTAGQVSLPDKEFRSSLNWGHIATSMEYTSLRRVLPACRHADGTISSSGVPDVRRMASEDSDQVLSGLAVIHRLRDLSDLDQARWGQMQTA